MFGMISKEELTNLKKRNPVGARVELIYMDDPYGHLEPGDQGTIRCVDDIGTVHVRWDCGSSLGLVYPEDSWKVL